MRNTHDGANGYVRLGRTERDEIARGLAEGMTGAEIAAGLGRNAATVSREVSANGGADGYDPTRAQSRADAAASSRKAGATRMAGCARLRKAVTSMLRRLLSPDQVSKRLRMDYPDDMEMRISPEAIYQYVYVLPKGGLRDLLTGSLRQGRKARRRKGGRAAERRGKIAEMTLIDERPEDVSGRAVPGHWEGDLVIGKGGRSAVATLVERVTRYVLIVRLRSRDADDVRRAVARAFSRLPASLRRSLTWDQGKEMSGHLALTAASGVKVYFAHPHAPWERPSNENTNGLVRQYFPKGTDLSAATAREVRRAQDQLNSRPRRVLEYHTPGEAFAELVELDSCVRS